MQKKKRGYKSVSTSIMLICFIAVLAVSTMISTLSIISIRRSFTQSMNVYHSAKDEGYRQEIVSETQSAISMVQMEYDLYKDGKQTEDEAKERAKEDIRNFRYRDDQSGYFWIDDLDYNLVMHPILTDQEGNNRKDLKDQKGNMIIQMIRKSCTSKDKGGFNEFYFTKADGKTVAPKLAYSQLFEPWGWMLSTGNYTDDMNKEMSATEKSIQRNNTAMLSGIIIVSIACILISTIIARKVGKDATKPLTEIKDFANDLSDGDLTHNINIKAKNEFGDTGRELNTARDNINSMMRKTTESCNALDDSINEFSSNFASMADMIQSVSSAVQNIAENNTEQAKTASDSVEGIESLAEGIDSSSESVSALDKNAADMMDCQKQSKDTLADLVKKNDATIADIKTMSDQTQQTSDSVKKIAEAANLISDIASQTNLLSLNASIEAARAGEAGRGFAVVAEEIGNLAQQSDESAQTINGIVEELVANSDKQISIMKRMSDMSTEQVEAFNKTSETFRRLENSLNECFASIKTISDNIRTMTEEKDRIKDNIVSLNSAATDNAASTEETSSMTAELDSIVSKSKDTINQLKQNLEVLTEAVSRFKV